MKKSSGAKINDVIEQNNALSSTHKINILNSTSGPSTSLKKSSQGKVIINLDSPVIPIVIKPFSC
jgi:hypothetical protein